MSHEMKRDERAIAEALTDYFASGDERIASDIGMISLSTRTSFGAAHFTAQIYIEGTRLLADEYDVEIVVRRKP